MGKKKVISEEELREEVMPGEGQVLGVVLKLFGNDQVLVKCIDGNDRLCRIRGSLKRRIWIKINDIVLVEPWEFQPESRGDILFRYTRAQVEKLQSQGHLKTFS